MGNTRAGCISQVEVLEQGDYVLRTTQAEVEDSSIRANNEAHFRLTEDTPTMQEPLKSALGYHGTDKVKQMLAGTYVCPPGVDAFTRASLETLATQHPLADNIDPNISKEDYMS